MSNEYTYDASAILHDPALSVQSRSGSIQRGDVPCEERPSRRTAKDMLGGLNGSNACMCVLFGFDLLDYLRCETCDSY